MNEVFMVSAVRTAIGTFGGSLRGATPCELGALVVREAVGRADVAPDSIGHVVFGQVIQTAPEDNYLARVAGVNGGLPHQIPALTVNRLCGSGLQAIVSAAQSILLGDCDIAVAGGAEVMSRAPFHAPDMRWGRKMGNSTLVDTLEGSLRDPFGRMPMGVTAENLAARHKISREDQDALAHESQRRAALALTAGHFREQIVPVEVRGRRGIEQFVTDEHIRGETTLEDLARLKPIFKTEDGTVTAGNASGINDGAAAVVLASAAAVTTHGLKPLARLVSYGHAGVDPAYMGIGPVPSTKSAVAKAAVSIDELDVIEANEAFAAQAIAVSRELGFDPARVNPNGSGISLGHPVGATGVIITTKLVHELQRTGGRLGLATMCIGGGQGISVIWERC
ncbi:acetyl-CoA C-acyltransferase family protein [Sphingobium sp.]|uniref:acetyl-CoA C-acyltransferase family protein n=1 Tax=Sphingobium sp. TaxID=1912891 RepID=UPI0028BE3752|nr:acetyl-CoA C-acyltransferase family protein [Sphingobium sp.]